MFRFFSDCISIFLKLILTQRKIFNGGTVVYGITSTSFNIFGKSSEISGSGLLQGFFPFPVFLLQ